MNKHDQSNRYRKSKIFGLSFVSLFCITALLSSSSIFVFLRKSFYAVNIRSFPYRWSRKQCAYAEIVISSCKCGRNYSLHHALLSRFHLRILFSIRSLQHKIVLEQHFLVERNLRVHVAVNSLGHPTHREQPVFVAQGRRAGDEWELQVFLGELLLRRR